MQRDKKLPPIPPQEDVSRDRTILDSTNTNKSKGLSLNLKDVNNFPNPIPNLKGCTSSDNIMMTKTTTKTPTTASLSSRRAGPPLTLNLRSNTVSNLNVSKILPPFDASLISPAQNSADSLDDSHFSFPVYDSDHTPSSARIPISKYDDDVNNSLQNRLSSNVVIKQQSSVNMMSTRLSAGNAKDEKEMKSTDLAIPLRSLNRRNLKKLTLDPINTSSNNENTDTNKLLKVKDPERRIDADELIKNIRSLELGLEYQMPIRADELIALKKLGSGQSGTVSKVLHLPTQKTMARKIVHLEAKEVIQSQIMRELRIMHECDSPFIIEFYGTFMNEGNVVICMEYADCGSLAHVFKITGPFPEFMLKHVAYSVLSGLIYLYDNHRIIHRDVKPSNVLLTSKGKIKLCDFGVSRELINSMADTFVGTSTYMSPERIQGGVYSVKGDVWSLGIMLYELASGNIAFANDNNSGPTSILELLQRIVNEQPPSLSIKDGFSRDLSDFVSLCLTKEKQRSSPWSLMNHPFLADFLEEDGMKVNAKYRGDIRKWAKNVRRVQKGKPIKDTP